MNESIDELRRREIQAAEAGDVDALLELRTDDFVAMPPGQPPVRGKDDVAGFLSEMFGAISVRETVTSEEVGVAGDVAYDRGVFSGIATVKETGDQIPLDGKYLWIATRQPGGDWKYSVQMWSDNRPPGADE